MSLRPNVHLLIPSSTPHILLESRLYLPSSSTYPSSLHNVKLTTSARSTPLPTPTLPEPTRQELVRVGTGVKKIVIAAHPWSKLGGNMLFPVISQLVVPSILDTDPSAVVITYNVRGVGSSGGSSSWIGVGQGPADFSAVERGTLHLLFESTTTKSGDNGEGGSQIALSPAQVKIYRLGYSYGSLLATLAPPPSPPLNITSTMLISPPLTLFRLFTLFSGGYTAALQSILTPLPRQKTISRQDKNPNSNSNSIPPLWIVYGTLDDFTSISAYRSLIQTLSSFVSPTSNVQGGSGSDGEDEGGQRKVRVRAVEVDGAAHFYVREEDSSAVREAIREWIGNER